MAAPIKLTPEVAEAVLKSLRAGNYRETAACSANLDPKTLRRWEKRGMKGEEPFKSFVAQMHKAEADAEGMAVAAISRAGLRDWRALAWRLEKKDPKRWGSRLRIELDNELEAFLDVLKKNLAPDVFEQIARVAAAAATGDQVPDDVGRLEH